MPYIDNKSKEELNLVTDVMYDSVLSRGISNGELNYLITCLCLLYINRHGKSYNTLSDVVKALECAKLEFYRREVAPYEDKKIEQNGDVY